MSTPLNVTRIGYACQLIEIGGTRVLTDRHDGASVPGRP